MILKEGLEKKRPAEGPPQSEPAQWWAEIAAGSASSGSGVPGNSPQPMPPHGMAPPVGTPMTPLNVPIDSTSGVPLPPYGFPPPLPPGYFYGPPPSGTMPAPAMPAQPGQSP